MKDPFKITVNDRHHFDIAPEQAETLDLINNGENNWHLLRDGQAKQVELLEADYPNRTYTLLVNGRRFKVQISDYYERLVQQLGLTVGGAQKQNTVKAPMPGLVVDILVKPGQTIQKGENLLILEAMKMENIIKATGEAVVKAIHVVKGAAVDKGQLMVEME
jgi:biotin carboxyl carrier protein